MPRANARAGTSAGMTAAAARTLVTDGTSAGTAGVGSLRPVGVSLPSPRSITPALETCAGMVSGRVTESQRRRIYV